MAKDTSDRFVLSDGPGVTVTKPKTPAPKPAKPPKK
jgi:hypothetical protein